MEKYIQWLNCYKIYTEVVQHIHGSQEKLNASSIIKFYMSKAHILYILFNK